LLLFVFLAVTTVVVLAGPLEAASAGGTRYVAPRGSDRNPCTRAKPCRSFNRAYEAARPGQVVVVRGGTYRGQVVRVDWRKLSSRRVVFRPARGASVFVRGSLKVSARHVEFQRIRVGTWTASAPALDVSFRSVRTGRFAVAGAIDVHVLGGSIGPYENASNTVSAAGSVSRHPPRDILLDGVTVHGFRGTAGSGPVHCLEVRAVNGLTVRRSRFYNCENAALSFTESGLAGPPANVTIENNVLAAEPTAISLTGASGERWANFRIRNNSSTGAFVIDPASVPILNLRFVSNIAASFTGCGRGGVSADYNVWGSGDPCGANDVVAPSGFEDTAANDLDLLPGSAAIDLGAPAEGFPSVDVAGQSRPVGVAPDAGAYESLASGLVAAYGFDEAGGSIAQDASGRGNLGVLSGAGWTDGRFGGALRFDGVDDWVTVADAASLDLTGNLTLEAWVKPDALGSSWRTVVLKEQATNLVYALYANTSTRNASGHVFIGSDRDTRTSSQLPLDTWTHVATTYDGSTLRFYVNGVQAAQRSVSGSLATSSGPLRLGGNGVWNEWFDGEIDEVRVYSRALPAAQLNKDMKKRVRGRLDAEGPTSPGLFVVSGRTSTSVSVSWTAAVDNVAVAGYGLYRNGGSVGSAGASALSYTFGGLSCGTSYTFAVDAYDGAGNRSSQASLSTATGDCPLPDTEAPSVPGAFAVSGQTLSSVSVAWGGSTDNVAVAGYGLYRNGSSVASTAAAARAYTFSGLNCGTTYTFALDAFDAAGNRSVEATLTAATSACPLPDGEAPTVPAGVASANVTTTSVALSWNASSDNVAVAGYGLYRNGTSVGTSSGTSYTFSGLTCETSYSLAVDAFDAAGNRSAKATLTATTSSCPMGGASVYLSSGGSDSNSCTQSAPCRSFDRAYRVASPGQTVEVAGGTYGGQTINTDSSKTSNDVVFRPAAGAAVTVSGEVSVYGDHIEFRDMTFGGWKTFLGTDDVTFRNIDTRHLFIWSSSNISMIGGSVGVLGQKTSYDSNLTTASGSSTPPTNILIDGVWFHDWIDVDPGQANHIECLQVGSGVNVTIRNSRFERCGTHDIFIRSWGTLNGSYHPLRNWVIENNFFGETSDGFYAIQFVDDMAPDATSFVVRNNSTLQAFHDAIERGTISFIANIVDTMTSSECGQSSASRWSYNLYESGVKCGSTDFVGAVNYKNRAAVDLHILAGSAAIGRGSPTSSAAVDIDGQSRPLGGGPDAGADEVP
jgi:chitodextrinase